MALNMMSSLSIISEVMSYKFSLSYNHNLPDNIYRQEQRGRAGRPVGVGLLFEGGL